MCGLCGLLGIVHWAETSAHPDSFTGEGRRTVRAERAHRAVLVNRALGPARVRVADFQAAAYIVRGATGRSEVVDDLSSVWGAVERLRGKPLDPLDEDWIAAMERSR